MSQAPPIKATDDVTGSGDPGLHAEETFSVGRELRRAREDRGLAVQDLAERTRIHRRHLEALESDRWDQLPGRLYARNFVKTVAQTLGLDDEQVARGFDLQLRREDEHAASVSAAVAPAPAGRLAATFALVVAVLAIIGVLGLSLARLSGAGAASPAGVEGEPAPAATPAAARDGESSSSGDEAGGAPAAAAGVLAVPAAQGSSGRAEEAPAADMDRRAETEKPGRSQRGGSNEGGASAEQDSPPEPGADQPEPVADESEAAADESEAAADESEPVARQSEPRAAPPEPQPEAPAARASRDQADASPTTTSQPMVRLRFRASSWVEVWREGDSQPLLGLKERGDVLRFRLDGPMKVHLGNSGGVQLDFDGLSAKPLGADGEPRTIRLDPQSWRSFLE